LKERLRGFLPILLIWLFFEGVAVTLWLTLDQIFYLFNFSYIGTALALGIFLYSRKHRFARRVVQFAVGCYMLIYLGVICRENMQLEGFWYYLFSGVFEAAVIHYAVAKLAGPFLFGRGWCGYACWSAMIFDLLPYPVPAAPRKKHLGWIRYLLFVLSLGYVILLFALNLPQKESLLFVAFIVGNILYYLAGIIAALLLKDNRAFCKYLCPITLFLKPASYFSLLRIQLRKETCTGCGKCRKVCPMDVDMTDPSRRRKNGTECILCMKCMEECPTRSLHL